MTVRLEEVRLTVRAGGVDRSYPVWIGAGLTERVGSCVRSIAWPGGGEPPGRWALIADERVAELYADPVSRSLDSAGLAHELFTFPEGEVSKSRAEWARLSDALLASGFDRGCGVVALGGGVTGDLAGFVAATYMRGLPVVQVPTTLLAMIDASVGGKTGVNTGAGKNLVGAFHPPVAVLIDPASTATLEARQRALGLVEAVKHGAILDAAYFTELDAEARDLVDGDVDATIRAVRRSVELKAGVVAADEFEGGRRAILNFGHTIGHGIEAATEYGVPHGAAVAAGMVAEARLGERMGLTRPGTSGRLEGALATLGLDGNLPDGTAVDAVIAALGVDKKSVGGATRAVLLREIGRVLDEPQLLHAVPTELVRDVLEGRISGGSGARP